MAPSQIIPNFVEGSVMSRFIRLLLVSILFVPLSACGLSSGPIEGRVLDLDTKQPVAGAIVVVRWEGTHLIPFADTQSSCYHAESAVTDDEGRYRIARWSAPSKGPLFTEDYKSFTVYKVGYSHFMESRYGESEDTKKNIYFLKAFKGSREERLKYLNRVSNATECASAGDSYASLLPLRRAVFEEAQPLAQTQAEKELVDAFLFNLEDMLYGGTEALKRLEQRWRGK